MRHTWLDEHWRLVENTDTAVTATSSRLLSTIGDGEFTEGFDTADQRDAKALLDELS